MARRPVILVHGYGGDESGFARIREALAGAGHARDDLHTVRYVSLSDEVSVRRLADAFELAVRDRLRDNTFDVVVYSTGALIVREWLRRTPGAARRLRNLVALAPANFGSPSAPLGRSLPAKAARAVSLLRSGDGGEFLTPWSEDFLEVGERLLRDLELASPITWELTRDELEQERWGRGDGSDGAPTVFTICGLDEYDERTMQRRRPGPGTDGTVRLSGVGTDADLLELDLRPEPGDGERVRFVAAPARMARPLFVIGLNHLTVQEGPADEGDELGEQGFSVAVDRVARALEVDSPSRYAEWALDAAATGEDQIDRSHRFRWQQFLVRVIDETGRPLEVDWTLELDVDGTPVHAFDRGAHVNSEAPGQQCFHVRVGEALLAGREATLRVITRPDSQRFAYVGIGAGDGVVSGASHVSAAIDLPLEGMRLFRAMATTLVEITLEGLPAGPRTDAALMRIVEPG
jgi:pimeloyl-ACP methyl ester carboxylesterase